MLKLLDDYGSYHCQINSLVGVPKSFQHKHKGTQVRPLKDISMLFLNQIKNQLEGKREKKYHLSFAKHFILVHPIGFFCFGGGGGG